MMSLSVPREMLNGSSIAKFIRTTRKAITTINCIFILMQTTEKDFQHLFS